MDLIKIHDKGGHSLTVLNYEGRLFPDFPREAIRGVATFTARANDVIVCAYPKSGTHWLWEMIRMLQAGTTEVTNAEKDEGMIELTVPEDLEKTPSPRTLNTHVHFELLPKDVLAQRSKVVYITRDPRDVGVSYFHHHRKLQEYYHYTGNWCDYFELFLQGKVDYESWFAYTKGWEQGIKDHPELPVLVTSYEGLHKDTVGELRRVAEFLSLKVEESLLTQIAHRCSFEAMRATKGPMETSESGSPIMYRKGKVGDWRDQFTVSQWESFERVFEKEMKGTQAHKLYSVKTVLDVNQNGTDAI